MDTYLPTLSAFDKVRQQSLLLCGKLFSASCFLLRDGIGNDRVDILVDDVPQRGDAILPKFQQAPKMAHSTPLNNQLLTFHERVDEFVG
jgi:hypothetical protein